MKRTCTLSGEALIVFLSQPGTLSTFHPCVQLNSLRRETLELPPVLYENPLVHFLINIFMTDYNLNPMSWVKSHIWMPWWRGGLIITVGRNIRNGRWPSWPNLWVLRIVSLLTLLTTLMDAKNLWPRRTCHCLESSFVHGKKSRAWAERGVASGDGTLHCRCQPSKMFYSSVGPQKQWNICSWLLPTLLKQCL